MTRVDTAPRADTVFVETAARLHFGLLDLRGDLGRKFGGIGAAAPAPTLLVSATPAETLEVTGHDAERAAAFARRFLDHHRDRPHAGARVHIHRALPSHAGLGSGTQLGLAVARALAEVQGISSPAADLARAVGRAQRSAIGTWTFAGGGLVVEGGRRNAPGSVAPLLARLPFPSTWHCVLAVPDAAPAISGAAEASALAQLPPPPAHDVARVAHLVLMALLPALADGDLATFGRALTDIQMITGRWFAAVQGGTYALGASEELVRRMSEWGAAGVGQSSWGPTVYGIVDGDEAGRRLAERLRGAVDALGATGCVHWGPFRNTGAHVWRTDGGSTSEGTN
jgi:beta-ribofuranosylaminobenzene 5'-phosphate synthase